MTTVILLLVFSAPAPIAKERPSLVGSWACVIGENGFLFEFAIDGKAIITCANRETYRGTYTLAGNRLTFYGECFMWETWDGVVSKSWMLTVNLDPGKLEGKNGSEFFRLKKLDTAAGRYP